MLRAEGATVLLVTHQLELLPAADTLVVMREGRAAYAGAPTPAALRAHFPQRDGGEQEQHVDEGLLSALGGAPEGAEGEPARAPLTPRSRSSTAGASSSSEAAEAARASPFSPRSRSGTLGAAAASSSSEAEALQRKALSIRAATLSSPGAPGAVTLRSLAHATTELPLALPGSPEYAALSAKRMAERITAGRGAEGGGAGSGRSSAYLVLLWELRVWVFLGLLGVFVTTQLVRIYSDIWVSVWVTKPFAGRGEEWYLSVYGGYVAAFCAMLLLRGWTFYSSFVAAVTRLHDKMFAALMRAPMSFFTLTPLGSVLSVVSLDMDRITEYLLEDVYMVMVYVMILGTTIGVVVTQVRVYLAVAAGLLALAVAVYVRYLAAASVLKGRAGAASTAVAAHLSETMQGIAVVQAFQAEARYIEHFQAKLHAAQGAQFTLACLNLWLTVRQVSGWGEGGARGVLCPSSGPLLQLVPPSSHSPSPFDHTHPHTPRLPGRAGLPDGVWHLHHVRGAGGAPVPSRSWPGSVQLLSDPALPLPHGAHSCSCARRHELCGQAARPGGCGARARPAPSSRPPPGGLLAHSRRRGVPERGHELPALCAPRAERRVLPLPARGEGGHCGAHWGWQEQPHHGHVPPGAARQRRCAH